MPSASIADRCDNQNVLRSDMLVLTEKTEAKACRLTRDYIRMGFVERLLVGGGFLRAQKRGRPDTWLYRQLQWRLALRHPALAALLGGRRLITRSGYWTTRRNADRGAP